MTNPIEEAVALLPDMMRQRDAAMKEENADRDVNHGVVVLWAHEADTIIAAIEAMRDQRDRDKVIGNFVADQRPMDSEIAKIFEDNADELLWVNPAPDASPSREPSKTVTVTMTARSITASDQKARDDAIWNEAVKALEEYETLAKKSGCGDGNCVVWKPTGMHTNGGCACVRTASYDPSLRAMIDQLLRIAQKTARAMLKAME